MSHPIHPVVVHFPIVFWSMSTMLDILSFWLGDRITNITGMLLLLGICAAILAVFAGLFELDKIKEQSPAMTAVNKHITFAILTCVFYTVSLCMRIDDMRFIKPEIITISLSMAGFICLCITGFLGGQLVYKFGIGVKSDNNKLVT